jgi:hypothetical protein
MEVRVKTCSPGIDSSRTRSQSKMGLDEVADPAEAVFSMLMSFSFSFPFSHLRVIREVWR